MRHAIVTAGTKGLGYQVTERFLKLGYSVTLTYRSDMEAVHRLKTKWNHLSNRLHFIQADITDREALSFTVEQAMKNYGRIDCLVNNAGPFIFERKKLMDYSFDEWQYMLDGNLSSVFHLLKYVIPIMRRQGHGRIVNYGFQDAGNAVGWQYRAAFAAAKVGLVSLTKSIAIEEAENGITSNMVCPGIILNDMKEVTITEAQQSKEKRTPMGRSVTGEDIARTITFLCDPDSDMINGAIIDVTGAVDVVNRFRPNLSD